MIIRNYYKDIWQKLSGLKSMIFIAGPRQSGKTTLAKYIARDFKNFQYFNWDIIDDKVLLYKNPYFFEGLNRKDNSTPLIILDEIHKYKDWKNYLKGLYDKYGDNYKFIISGSGRLDIYNKGGDSLAGRYLLFNLWPFSLGEMSKDNVSVNFFIKSPEKIFIKKSLYEKIWCRLKNFSGFPEPYVKKSKEFYRIWSRTYHQQLIREDIRNASQVKYIDQLEILFLILPTKIGSPLSISSLAKIIKVSYDAVKTWIRLFEQFFLIFKVSAWSKNISRAIVKEQKIYLLDYAVITDLGAKFENMVAFELMRMVSNLNALGKGCFSLHFIRNKEKEEVDFLITNDNKPILLLECKLNNDNVSKSLLKFQKMLKIPAVQLVDQSGIYRKIKNDGLNITVISACDWLCGLP